MKVAGPVRVLGHTLKTCADQLAVVSTSIFNLSLQQAAILPPPLSLCLKNPLLPASLSTT